MSLEMRANEPLSEAAAWRGIARRIDRAWRDEGLSVGLFGALSDLKMKGVGNPHLARAEKRVRFYDSAGRDRKDYDAMESPDRVLAALWLALEAEDDARSALRSSGPGAP